MKNNFELPIIRIGEPDWINRLQHYLESIDVEVAGIDAEIINRKESELSTVFPEKVKQYYLNFGGIQSSDFMYGLKPVEELQLLFASNISFISFNFKMYEINTMMYFAQSPAGDPLCFDKDTGEIYLFSHDPIKKARVFEDFNQYLLHEIIEAEKLVGEGLDEDYEKELKKEYLSGENLDYAFRELKL